MIRFIFLLVYLEIVLLFFFLKMEGKIKLEWDKFAPLTQEQNELIVNLSQVLNDRPIPTKVTSEIIKFIFKQI